MQYKFMGLMPVHLGRIDGNIVLTTVIEWREIFSYK